MRASRIRGNDHDGHPQSEPVAVDYGNWSVSYRPERSSLMIGRIELDDPRCIASRCMVVGSHDNCGPDRLCYLTTHDPTGFRDEFPVGSSAGGWRALTNAGRSKPAVAPPEVTGILSNLSLGQPVQALIDLGTDHSSGAANTSRAKASSRRCLVGMSLKSWKRFPPTSAERTSMR